MSYDLRSFIEKTILEASIKRKKYKYWVGRDSLTPDQRAHLGISRMHPSKSNKNDQHEFKDAIDDLDQEKYNDAYHGIQSGTKNQRWTLKKRKWLKKNWHDRVHNNLNDPNRSEWFSSLGPIRCIHCIGAFDETLDLDSVNRFLELHLAGGAPLLHELSALGYLKNTKRVPMLGAPVAIEYKVRDIHWASTGDIGSEWISSATPQLIEFFDQTGLKKYPSTWYSAGDMIFCEEDWRRKGAPPLLGELIIQAGSNSVDDVIIYLDSLMPDEDLDIIQNHILSIDNYAIIKI